MMWHYVAPPYTCTIGCGHNIPVIVYLYDSMFYWCRNLDIKNVRPFLHWNKPYKGIAIAPFHRCIACSMFYYLHMLINQTFYSCSNQGTCYEWSTTAVKINQTNTYRVQRKIIQTNRLLKILCFVAVVKQTNVLKIPIHCKTRRTSVLLPISLSSWTEQGQWVIYIYKVGPYSK